MSYQNQLLPFATGGGANVMSNADYQALTARSAGFGGGVAQSVQLNTVWRQAAFVAAMIGQFTADNGIADVLDNGDVAGFETNFVAALQKFYPPGTSLLHYGVASGTANALIATVSPAIAALVAGTTLLIKVGTTNTGGAATINPELDRQRVDRPGRMAPIRSMEISKQGAIAVLIYDGTNFQIATSMMLGNDLDHYGVDTGSTNALVVPTLNPPLLSYQAGTTLKVKIANTNNGSATVNAAGLGVKSIKSQASASLAGGEMVAGSVATLIYDGTQFYLVNAQAAAVSNTSGGITAVATTSPIHGTGVSGDAVRIDGASTSGPGAVQLATAAQYAGNSGNGSALTPDQVWGAAAFINQTFAPTITLDGNAGFNWFIGGGASGVTGNFVLANPQNFKSGQEGFIYMPQDGVGNHSLTLGSAWVTPGGFPGLSTGPNAKDGIAYKCIVGGSNPLIFYSVLRGAA